MFEGFTVHYLNIQYLFGRIYFGILRLVDPEYARKYGAPVSSLPSDGGAQNGAVFGDFIFLLKIVAVVLSVLFIIGIIYCVIRLRGVMKRNEFTFAEITPDQQVAPRADQWARILSHVSSENPSDWKLAVLEADTMLDELLTELKIPGDTLGEQLKNADPADFRTLNDAWEGHKVRNRVAHEGISFVLTKREARRAIEYFERVFKEFKLI